MAGHGGYRRPANPAPVSGPGALSRRTDGKQPVVVAPGGDYGDAQQLQQLQQASPLPQAASMAAPGPATLADLTSGVTPLSAPSAQPDVPVTDGAALGPGAGTSALGLDADPNLQDAQYLSKYLPVLMKQANSDSATPGYKSWVRNLIANLKQ